MPWAQVTPVMLECPAGQLCSRRYPNHPKGCPNYGTRAICPPRAERWTAETFNGKLVWAVWYAYPFGERMASQRKKHPTWTKRQLANPRHWQNTAVARLKNEVADWKRSISARLPRVEYIPEAHGVDVTNTMRSIGVLLEWPPVTWVYKVAIAMVSAS